MEKRLSDSEANENLKNDEDYLFLMSILPSMKKLTDLQKLRFWGKINDWLLEAITQNQYSYFSQPGPSQVNDIGNPGLQYHTFPPSSNDLGPA
jgi:hypothetical protein